MALLAFVACGVQPSPEGTTLTDGSIVYTLSCEDSWSDCYRDAEKICGKSGFEELDRLSDGTVTSAGHLARMHSIEGGKEDHVYSEDVRKKVFNRVVTIRCNTP